MDKNSKKYKAARKAKALEYGKSVRKTNKLRREKDQEREAVLKRENPTPALVPGRLLREAEIAERRRNG
ncbi:MAG: hypothetical protein ACK5S6_04055 [bacterium]|jgi:hypothetical protein